MIKKGAFAPFLSLKKKWENYLTIYSITTNLL